MWCKSLIIHITQYDNDQDGNGNDDDVDNDDADDGHDDDHYDDHYGKIPPHFWALPENKRLFSTSFSLIKSSL